MENKKIVGLILCAVMLISSVCISQASSRIEVVVDDNYLKFDVQPQIINDRTMVPLRAIFEALGATIEWNNYTQTITATRDDIVVMTTIGDTSMYINGVRKRMDVAPVIINERTLVPVRFVAEAFDCDVVWVGDENTVYISSNQYGNEVIPTDEYNNLTEEELYEMNS